jgi:hypothetical protein
MKVLLHFQLQSPLDHTTLQLHYIPPHYTTLHYTPRHWITLHYTYNCKIANATTLHYIRLHYTNHNYIRLHYITLIRLHYTRLHSITLHYTTLHYIALHYTTLHYTTPYYTPPRHTTLNCGWVGRCNHSKKHNSNHISVYQWIRSAIRASQELTSPIVVYPWNFRHRLVRY